MNITLELETRLVNAWPSFETEFAGGWLLRFAEGYSKRANSATPILPGATLDAELIESIDNSFAARGVPTCFRLTGQEDPACAALLEARGLVAYDPSLALWTPLASELTLDPSITLHPVATPAWIRANAAAYGGDKANDDILGRIVGRIRQPAAFATLNLDGEDAAWGFAVAERGRVGIYDIVVAPELRGLGLGRRLVTGLMSWGHASGATSAYLQMREENQIAFALYQSLGFEIAYRYSHRVPVEPRRKVGKAATKAPATVSKQARAKDGEASA